ncbi:perilipin-2 isoform X2 [Lingula anatina]|uniref:Perilipin-2 isoform X2 n=1 Tax=Lingula anatina TaxID=7574 RepID=A0A1S3HTM7_LINAN|nr:perilipin-2 isoform X2 [Lingula anatina]|eukprot:XP_013389392.1 perilipin-2 isoform X2 [Lingula anatina]
MYRKSLEKKMSEEQFITRVSSLPVVSSAWGQVSDYYLRTKEKSPSLVQYTLNMAESSVKTAYTTAQPVISKLDGPIQKVNAIACQQLDKLEEKYPIISKDTETVIEKSKGAYNNAIQPTVDKVNAVKQYGVDTYNGVKDYGVEKVTNVKNFATGTVTAVKDYSSSSVNSLLQSSYGQVVVGAAEGILASSEGYVEKYLPPAPEEEEKKEGDEGEEGDEQDPQVQTSLARVTSLSSKVRRRMYARAMKEMQHLQARSKETVANLAHTVNLIQYARDNFELAAEKVHAAKEKAWSVWEEVNKEEDEEEVEGEEGEEGKELQPQTLERRSILVARRLTLQLKHALAIVPSGDQLLPVYLRERMDKAKTYVEEMYGHFAEAKHFEDLPSWMMDQAKEKLTYVEESVGNMTEYVLSTRALSWLVGKKEDTVKLE